MSFVSYLTSCENAINRRPCTTHAIEFLSSIWDGYGDRDYTTISTRSPNSGEWIDHFVRGNRKVKLEKLFKRFPPDKFDLYFCPNAFSAKARHTESALPTYYSWSDIDDTDPSMFKPTPNILWESSVGRHQGLWIWDSILSPEEARQYSRNLWQLYGGDKGACSITKVLRIPGTINHKPERNGDCVRLLNIDLKPRKMPKRVVRFHTRNRTDATIAELNPWIHDPYQVMQKYRQKMGLVAGTLMTATRVRASDRSGKVHLIAMRMMELGACDNEVASLLWVNPYFTDKWGQNISALEREVSRARHLTGTAR